MKTKAELLAMKQQIKERKQSYYSLRGDVNDMKYKLQSLKKHRGHSSAFELLLIALDTFQDQVNRDYRRYESRIRSIEAKDVAEELQQSLNRERAKNLRLEAKIKEASESSGLFIKYVRKALGVGEV